MTEKTMGMKEAETAMTEAPQDTRFVASYLHSATTFRFLNQWVTVMFMWEGISISILVR